MTAIKEFEADRELWQKNLEVLFPDSYLTVGLGGKLFDVYVDMIQFSFPETYKDDWVFYYIYDCEMGTKNNQITINGKDYPLNTEEQLYNLLCNNTGL